MPLHTINNSLRTNDNGYRMILYPVLLILLLNHLAAKYL